MKPGGNRAAADLSQTAAGHREAAQEGSHAVAQRR